MKSQKPGIKYITLIIDFIKDYDYSFTATKPQASPHNAEDGGEKFERGGASIVYVHTFCSELLGESSTLDLCR